MARKSKKSTGLGRAPVADKAIIAMSGPVDPINAAPKSKKSIGVGQELPADEASYLVPAQVDPINAITLLYRDYSFAQEQRKRMDLALGAYLRRALGWRKDMPEKERKAIATQAATIAESSEGTPFEVMVTAHIAGRACFDGVEADTLKAMTKLATTLPVWQAWAYGVRGFGAKSLAVIVAEAGDLSNYSDKSKLWKRMGLAVMGDVRQGGLKKGAGAEAWIEHGYSPKRRSQMFVIGDTMLKAQIRKIKDDLGEDTGARLAMGLYGQVYLDRKVYELSRNPEMTPMHAHRGAQRYMEKRLLKDLWQTWRAAPSAVSSLTKIQLPLSKITAEARI